MGRLRLRRNAPRADGDWGERACCRWPRRALCVVVASLSISCKCQQIAIDTTHPPPAPFRRPRRPSYSPTMTRLQLHDGLSEPLGDPLIAAIEDALTLVTFSFVRPRRHDALLEQNAVPTSWAAWRTQPALYALLDRIARSHTGRPSHLAAALGLSRSTVSHELRRLEDRRLIYRNDFPVQQWRGKVRPLFAPTVQGYNALRQLRSVRRGAVADGGQDLARRRPAPACPSAATARGRVGAARARRRARPRRPGQYPAADGPAERSASREGASRERASREGASREGASRGSVQRVV